MTQRKPRATIGHYLSAPNAWSPGLLVGSRDLASLGQGVRSIPRNHNLGRLAKTLGLVVAWGTGFRKKTASREGVNEGVNPATSLLLPVIRETPGQRSLHYAKHLKTSAKNIERWLTQLKAQGLVEFHGAPKTGGYHPTAPDRGS